MTSKFLVESVQWPLRIILEIPQEQLQQIDYERKLWGNFGCLIVQLVLQLWILEKIVGTFRVICETSMIRITSDMPYSNFEEKNPKVLGKRSTMVLIL
ncbi:8885_t:CDS:2 [Gigaspora rosea]|nr:8885_t:CDS:2 [Gigaspora rosea]